MIKIKINNKEYANIASIEPSIEYDFYHNVKTLDGKIHREVKGKKTNYSIVFFNQNFAEYDALKNFLETAETVALTVPDKLGDESTDTYLPTVKGYQMKGILMNGIFYSTALSVMFEKVGYDE